MTFVSGRVLSIQGTQPGIWSRGTDLEYRMGTVTVLLQDEFGEQLGYLSLRANDLHDYQIGDVMQVTYGKRGE